MQGPSTESSPLSGEIQEWLAHYLIRATSFVAPALGGLLVYRWSIGILPSDLAALPVLLIPLGGLEWITKRLSLRAKSAILVGVFALSAAATFGASGLTGVGPMLGLVAAFSALAFYGNRAFLISVSCIAVALVASEIVYLDNAPALALDLSVPINAFGRTISMAVILGVLLFGVRRIISLVSDQTDSARATRQDLGRAVEELDLFIDSANAPIFGIDSHGRIDEWNAMAASITGYSKQEVLGKDLVNTYITDGYKASVATVLERALAGRNTANYEFPLFSKTGDRIVVLLNAATRRDAAGAIIGVLGVGQDITSLREQEELLRQAQKMESMGRLTGGIAHDFNNLLTVIKGNLELAVDSLGHPDEMAHLKDLLNDASAASSDAANLTRQLLSIASQQSFTLEAVDLRRLVARVVGRAASRLPNGVECSVNIDQVDMDVMTDSAQFEAALVHLFNNARDAVEGDGNISVEVHVEQFTDESAPVYSLPSGEYIVVTVTDDGCGIPESSLPKVAEPFFTTKDVGAGVGLGLSMAKSFAGQLGGEVCITSAVGVGTTVLFLFPLLRSHVDAPPGVEPRRYDVLHRPGTVLVVEDESRLRKLVVRYLSASGFEVIEAAEAGRALEILAVDEGEIDTVFSDIRMPGDMSGRELAAAVSRLYPTIRLLLTSGYEEDVPDSSEKDRSPHWDIPVLRKPYSREELIDALVDLPRPTEKE